MTDAQGNNIFKGRRVTAVSNAEDEDYKAVQVCRYRPHPRCIACLTADGWFVQNIPWLVETRIRELGGIYGKAYELWGVSAD